MHPLLFSQYTISMKENLYELFKETVSIPYITTGTSVSYAVKKKRETLYLFFEHSDGKEDWKKNLNFPIKAYETKEGKTLYAHRGFLRAWKEIEGVLSPFVRNTANKRIVISGFSHGAALALLCHESVWFHRPDARETLEGYGFGCPRVIWGRKTKETEARFVRFTVVKNVEDIVTHLPPAFLGYTHVGNMLSIGEKGKYSAVSAHYEQNYLTELKALQTKG